MDYKIFTTVFFKNIFEVDVERSYPFYYNPNFKPLEDGWSLFQAEVEFTNMVRSDSNWRISHVNKGYAVSYLVLLFLPIW